MSAVIDEPLVSQNPLLAFKSLEELVRQLGDIPLSRIRLHPPIGTATEADLMETPKPFCELIDGTLVEKAMGFFESRIGSVLVFFIDQWLLKNDIGFVIGDGGLVRMESGNVRVPDVLFIRWDRVGEHRVPKDPISSVVPNLAVEVLSRTNTRKEIERKRQQYFDSGVELVWIIEPELKTVEVWNSPQDCHIANHTEFLSGEEVLPGFRLSIEELFDRAEGTSNAT